MENGNVLNNLKSELISAILKYSSSSVDLVKDFDNNIMYGIYHSKKNSFPVTKDYAINLLPDDCIEQFCNELDIGYSEI